MTTEQPKYKNIPVPVDTYDKVQLISEMNGYGQRGMGAQVKAWAARDLPECEHEKQPVEIEIMPSGDVLPGTKLIRHGLYCSTCKRVYASTTIQGGTSTSHAVDAADGGSKPPQQGKKRQRIGRDF